MRIRRGLRRTAVAKHLGITDRHLYRIETGQTRLRQFYADQLAELYAVDVAEITNGAQVFDE